MGNKLEIDIGLCDKTENQSREICKYDIFSKNMAIFGGPMSGKTTLIKQIILNLHQKRGLCENEEVFVLDFSNNLKEYAKLPYVVAYFDATQVENVRRMFRIIFERLNENKKLLNGDVFVNHTDNIAIKHITFIVDGMNFLLSGDNDGKILDSLLKILREGISKGVTTIFTANDCTSGISKMLPSVKQLVTLDVSEDLLMEVFSTKVVKPPSRRGRGNVNNFDGADYKIYEFQSFYIDKDKEVKLIKDICDHFVLYNLKMEYEIDKILDEIKDFEPNFGTTETEDGTTQFLDAIKDYYQKNQIEQTEVEQLKRNLEILRDYSDKEIKSFWGELTKETWKDYTGDEWDVYFNGNSSKHECTINSECAHFTAGLNIDNMEPVKVDLLDSRTIAIYGKKQSGKTNLLKLILETARKMSDYDVELVLWEDGRQGITSKAPELMELYDVGDSIKSSVVVNSYKEFLCQIPREALNIIEEDDFINNKYNITGSKDEFVEEEFEADVNNNASSFINMAVSKENAPNIKTMIGSNNIIEKEEIIHFNFSDARRELLANSDDDEDISFDYDEEYGIDYYSNDEKEDSSYAEDINEASENNIVDDEMILDYSENSYKVVDWDERKTTFRIYVIQSRLFYQMNKDTKRYPIEELEHFIIDSDTYPNKLFIFSDVQKMDDSLIFNNSIDHAFLLEDIIHFSSERGKKSVFGDLDIVDLKEQFGPCELGEGYYYDLSSDDIIKLRFIKHT